MGLRNALAKISGAAQSNSSSLANGEHRLGTASDLVGKATTDSLTPTNPGTLQPHKSMADLQSPVTINEQQYQALKGKVNEQVKLNTSSSKGYRTAGRLLKSDYTRNNAFYGVKGYARQAIKYAAKSAKLLAGFGAYAQGKRKTFAGAAANYEQASQKADADIAAIRSKLRS